MVRLAADLTLMFNEHRFLDRFDAAAQAGFKAVECLTPYRESAAAIQDRLQRNGLKFVLFSLPFGNWERGDRGIAADPRRIREFRRTIPRALEYARLTGCRKLQLLAGRVPPEADRAIWRETLLDNIRFAADWLADEGMEVLLEPINTRVDVPGYFYDTTSEVLAIMNAAERPNVRLLYNIYHMQIMEGDLARTITRLLARIGHIRIADNPGRHEPGTGEINYRWLLSHLTDLGYESWIGCEYQPAGPTVEGLDWARPYLS